jgi:hypothetical protein
MNPLSANRQNSRLSGDIATADWLILDEALDTSNEPNASLQLGSDQPLRVIANQFTLVRRWGSYSVFVRKPNPAPPTL